MQMKSWRPHKYCKWPEDVTRQQMVVVARRQWLISSGTHEDEKTLVVWEELYFNQWHRATDTVGLQWSQRSQTPEHSKTLITDHFACRSLTEYGCKLINCTNVTVRDQRCHQMVIYSVSHMLYTCCTLYIFAVQVGLWTINSTLLFNLLPVFLFSIFYWWISTSSRALICLWSSGYLLACDERPPDIPRSRWDCKSDPSLRLLDKFIVQYIFISILGPFL